MKKSILILGLAVSFILYTGCQSTKNTVSDDSLDDETDVIISDTSSDEDVTFVEEDSDDYDADESNEENKKSGNVNKKTSNKMHNFLDSLLTSSFRYYDYDEFSFFTPNNFGKIKQTGAMMVYAPKNDMFGFGSTYLVAYYFVQFDEDARNKLTVAYNQYLKDFENKRLDRNAKKTAKIYGSAKVKINWGTIKSSCPNSAATKIYFGYEFKNGSPYFRLYVEPVFNDRYKDTTTAPRASIDLTYYLTKAQGAFLTKSLSKESTDKVLRDYYIDEYGDIPSDSDSY